MTELHRIALPGNATGICAITQGYIFIEMRANWDQPSQMQLVCFNFAGQQIWLRDFIAPYRGAVKVANQAIWLSNGKQIYRLDADGVVTQVIPVPLADSEYIGDYVVTKDGFFICSRGRGQDTRSPQILCIATTGQVQWGTRLVKPSVSYTGVVEASTDTNWQAHPKRPWTPTSWQPDSWQPLLATSNRLLATYVDYSSGIAVSYCLNSSTGELQWATPSRPGGNKSLGPNQTFLIGSQGYGEFASWLYDANGQVLQHWQSHGYAVLSEQAEIRVVEMQNVLPSRMSFSIFELSGQVRKGPHLANYYTAYPSIDKKGTVICWRDDKLLTVDTQLNLKNVYSLPTDKADLYWFSRTLLLQPDKLAFIVSKRSGTPELWIFNTSIDSLATSDWPCGGGNLGNNPLYTSE